MRLFVGIELDAELAVALDESIEPLRLRLNAACPGLSIRWVPRANLHLTLVFIGMADEKRRAAVMAALDPTLPHEPFDGTFGGFGIFPATGPPGVIWLGVPSGHDRLAALQHEVSERLAIAGVEPEPRPYVAHLTLARVKGATGSTGRVLRQAVREAAAPAAPLRVRAVTLFLSQPSPRGSSYQPLMRVPLRG